MQMHEQQARLPAPIDRSGDDVAGHAAAAAAAAAAAWDARMSQPCRAVPGCCARHPGSCSGHVPLELPKPKASTPAQRAVAERALRHRPGSHVNSDRNSTFDASSTVNGTFWAEPVLDEVPYDQLVAKLLAPFASTGIKHERVWRSVQSRSTCAILRVAADGTVCKVPRTHQRRERNSHAVQERGLFELVGAVAARLKREGGGRLPSMELSYCPGDVEFLVADARAARWRWGGRTGCSPAAVYASSNLLQFRCQAKTHLPFMMWYREETFGRFSEWDATTARLRAEADRIPWAERRPVAFFRGSLNEAMGEDACLASRGRSHAAVPSRCRLLHHSREHPALVDYSLHGNRTPGFAGWASAKYVLFVEGTEEWADRLKLLLQLGSVVLAQSLWCNEHYACACRSVRTRDLSTGRAADATAPCCPC